MVSFKQIVIVYLIFCSYITLQQDDDSDDCSFISGEGCLNGVCKLCAMCLPSACILATPYSTGDNDGSTCAVTNQPYGYDFYNYCLSSGSANENDDSNGDDDTGDDDEDNCNTSTACYPYRQGDLTQHIWRNLTCNASCQLVLNDGSPPPKPVPLANITSTTNTYHPPPGNTSSGNINPHRNQFDPSTKSPTSIALITVCSVVLVLLVIWLVRTVFYKTKHWPWINRYLCCGFCKPPIVPLPSSSLSQNTASTPNSRPPSFQSNHVSPMRQHSINSHYSSYSSLPSYHCQDPSLPKYEQAIVTQIRGMSFFDHHSSSSSSSTQQQQQQPIWIPIYLSSSSVDNSTIVSSPIFNSLLPSSSDWARPINIRHQPWMRSQTSLAIEDITAQQDDDE